MMPNNHDHSTHANISPARLEAFSDGVMAIIITITVIELKAPANSDFRSLLSLTPLFFTYLVSFQTVGTYWNNHHHLLSVTKHISADIMWANLNLLFWLSLIPFGAAWLGLNHGDKLPTAVYSGILLCCALAYSLLQRAVIFHAENKQALTEELNRSKKGLISLISYILAVILAFFHPLISDCLILLVAIMWFFPDRRLEKYI